MESTAAGSPYYMHTGKMPLASRISFQMRKKMFELFMANMHPSPETLILDLGVTSDNKYRESNYFEKFYPYKHKLVCAGTEDGSYLEHQYPGVTFVPVIANQPLPFSDGQFDIVFSNAVIEHAGGAQGQKFFIKEVLRVGKTFFVTTPNRWFPAEMHTGLPFLHYLPMQIYRTLIATIGLKYWSLEENLSLLDTTSLLRLFPPSVIVKITTVKFFGIPSNLIAYGQAPDIG